MVKLDTFLVYATLIFSSSHLELIISILKTYVFKVEVDVVQTVLLSHSSIMCCMSDLH